MNLASALFAAFTLFSLGTWLLLVTSQILLRTTNRWVSAAPAFCIATFVGRSVYKFLTPLFILFFYCPLLYGESEVLVSERIDNLTTKRGISRTESIRALGDMGAKAKSALPILISEIDNEYEPDASAAIIAAAKIGPSDKRVVLAISKVFDSERRWVINSALRGLLNIDSSLLEPLLAKLIQFLSSEYFGTRQYAARNIARLGSEAKDAIPALKKAIVEPLENNQNQNRKYYFHVCIDAYKALRQIDLNDAENFRPTVQGYCKDRLP